MCAHPRWRSRRGRPTTGSILKKTGNIHIHCNVRITELIVIIISIICILPLHICLQLEVQLEVALQLALPVHACTFSVKCVTNGFPYNRRFRCYISLSYLFMLLMT
jgi:hypothetical protein